MLTIREKKVLFAASDVVFLALSAAIAWVLVIALSPTSPAELSGQMIWVALMACVLFVTSALNDCLDVISINSREKYLKRWGISWGISFIVYLLLFFLLGRAPGTSSAPDLPRLIPGIFCLVAFVAVPVGRNFWERILGITTRKKTCIVVGGGGSGRHFVEEVASTHSEWQVLVILDDDPAKIGTTLCGVKVVGNCARLVPMLSEHDIQEVVLAISHEMKREVIDSLLVCFERGVDVVPVSMAIERSLGRVPINHLGDKWLPTTFWASSSMPLFYRVLKRFLDLVAAFTLLALTFPLLILAIVATKATSRGPAFYRQERVGLKGTPFQIIKIRTMRPDAEAEGARWTAKNDNRITPAGRLLRATRIDELPQLWNVFRGDMSLVGPRPERPEFVEKLEKEIPYYRARLCVRPGITGWAQVNQHYANSVEDSKTKLEYDLYYIKHRSLVLDFYILGKTIKTVATFCGL